MINLDELGSLLKKKRREKKISQTQIGEYLGLSMSHISDIERGVHKISVQTLCGYCDLIGMTPNDLLEISTQDEVLSEINIIINKMSEDNKKKLLSIAKILES